ncbi:FAD-dependent oxidoreductase [Paenibacillus sp. J5C_2022]|uniref:FAD-dependent oxidoreductase n=1 Tax=Paenibacillus sp. J5C2022 TaxID=2977129 RepID=UPI0021D2BD09|nr:FAD-dependent oxidoreductase [Paenibacillus sp. J5C2022]MCU6712148.1 FAD-dependent oxidoreductase [Paenibacillus sp. J5C2022]
MTDFRNLKYYVETPPLDAPVSVEADLCIYGGSSAGIAAAVQARRMGLRVVIAEFGNHLGGLTTGGLGATDIGNKAAIGGISREFYRALGTHYGTETDGGTQWTFEPSVAGQVYQRWLEENEIEVYCQRRLKQVGKGSDGRIKELIMENGEMFRAAMFIDATYEGDLMAMAGVSYHVGREANSVYQETLNGVHYGHPHHRFETWIDPYRIPGKPDSGLLQGVTDAPLLKQGEGDASVQAYNFRICLTNMPDNCLPFPQPPGYDPDEFQLLARYIQSGIWDAMQLHKMMPRGKSDLNNRGAVSTDYIGGNHKWPEASYKEREGIFQEHFRYNLGMLYFLANDESIPKAIRDEASKWGLPADEYPATGHWTPQLYIREARRMISDVVMTERHCRRHIVVEDPIGLAAYGIDSHHCRRVVIDGRCVNEGNVEIHTPAPFPVSYRSIVPRRGECANLLVPVCLSSSHIAFGSIRMEPVFMILGQSAATAAALALEADITVQDVDYKPLRERLLADGQILDWA